MEFNSDGSLKVSKKSSEDHISVFKLIDELEFFIGKKLLMELLRGETNSKVMKHNFHRKIYHGCLGGYEKEEISLFIDYLINLKFLRIKKEKGLYSVLVLTDKAREEIDNKEFSFKVDGLKDNTNKITFPSCEITEKDKLLFKEFDFFLKEFTDEQKKAIIETNSKQICIAGAGSGKTKVLTNKIVFLVKFLGVNPQDILAITFTRKARHEMMSRLSKLLPDKNIRIETFNSFAEKEISYHSLLLYGKEKRMASSKEFIRIITIGINELGFTVDKFLDHYFTKREKRNKDSRQLFFSFLYDFSAILDSFIQSEKNVEEFMKKSKFSKLCDRVTAENLVQLVQLVSQKLEFNSLRTYSDQLVDIVKLYKDHPKIRKNYPWVLVDEYQDINEEQFQLLNLISSKNMFVVGDPRQSIFAWRGANPDRVTNFIEDDVSVMQLTTNFRSHKKIVQFTNELIGDMGFQPTKSNSKEEGAVIVTQYSSEDDEATKIINEVLELQIPRKEIFILSRTNKGLEKIKNICDFKGIKYLMRTDEKKQINLEPKDDEITLSTVHAIKGLEAKVVYVIGTNYQNYPCKAKDHRFVELFASTNEYDQIQEEKRLLYVACTRAKNLLRITYTSTISPFITSSVLKSVDLKKQETNKISDFGKQRNALKRWRYLEAKDRGIAPYQIFTDSILEQLIELQPKDITELEFISGFNPAKRNEFGYDIISIMLKNA